LTHLSGSLSCKWFTILYDSYRTLVPYVPGTVPGTVQEREEGVVRSLQTVPVQERSPSSGTGESFVQYHTVVRRRQLYLVPAWDMTVIVYP
jgi:hypothetical protein